MGSGVYTINADGSEERLLIESHCCPDWSANGRLMTPALTTTSLFTFATFDGDGSNYKVMPNDDPSLHLACDTWSPDGARALCGGWDDTNPSRNGVYSRRSSDGGDVQLVTLTPRGRVAAGDYAPDGSRIAFLTESEANAGAGIFVVNVDGTGLDKIIERAADQVMHGPTWSPDGQWILFDADDRLFLVHPDGTGRRDIPLDVTGRYSAYEAAWSPDGSRIVFSLYTHDDGRDDLFTAAVDGSELFQVTKTRDAQEGQPDWGPAIP
jgi:Tol biopolymer transport system component